MDDNLRDLPIGEGTTTLDYLVHVHPWLGKLLDEQKREIERLKNENDHLRVLLCQRIT